MRKPLAALHALMAYAYTTLQQRIPHVSAVWDGQVPIVEKRYVVLMAATLPVVLVYCQTRAPVNLIFLDWIVRKRVIVGSEYARMETVVLVSVVVQLRILVLAAAIVVLA